MFLFFLITISPENGPWTKECTSLEETMRAYVGLESNKDNSNECFVAQNYLFKLSQIFSLKKKIFYYYSKKQKASKACHQKKYFYCDGEIFEILK
ncbi:hypothetical protein [Alphaproteobacteria bacterium endosymbiont of Tiliacea citrago]|uniref:hypothetical protein n=1 Tax=Alphaproteobacteria bacterium endosymbiont of Tiliacea citrago TaxID=3077944 RepID=UPI00313AA3C3